MVSWLRLRQRPSPYWCRPWMWSLSLLGGGGECSATQRGDVTHGKLVIVLHDHTSHTFLCCNPIEVEGVKVCLNPIRDCEVQAHSAPGCWNPVSTKIYFQALPWENLAYCAPVGDVGMWVSHWELVVSFPSSSLSEKMLALNTWENMREAEEDSPNRIVE